MTALGGLSGINVSAGRVNPEDFTHGTSEQRVNWFNEGYRTGDPAACDTFNNEI